ncbi:bifunctional 3-phosphoshikimate 1-carboxyvinyltransferase/cytidylate kinase [Comamonas sp. NLF-1-9]|uniref:bifunctional 3-phosphoshikimate 1-carboxyvinyltransferase/cytidylate kinase n=1 Tax=Comamonas sp. NLF-1-9 TaxID=2853163 RepID=UPI001C455CC7|nr:bifunctional 3-phosphoshikimate 1-carboxyvinyltransferase/cytidylate kinase [Comamonas sp. NLF-1-9]QXL85068.1 bifunctional 3-phosphoshikimate 1-carboxyvinyltransferase/cytidylate kinase [Comamonas sp. NLF-1-9]
MGYPAFLDIPALQGVAGCVRLPGSKSISNRVLLLAALSEGSTEIRGLLHSDDTRVMLDALRQLGCTVQEPDADRLCLGGLGASPPPAHGGAPVKLFLGNAGTAMRPLAAALALRGGHYELSGVARMHERPIGDLVQALQQLGCAIEYLGTPGFPPLRIRQDAAAPLALDRPIRVRGDVSSQFLTALLMALPQRAQQRALSIEVVGELISKPYIDITLALLERFGIALQRDGYRRFTILAGSRYRSPGVLQVEADASSASYFIAAGAIAASDAGQNGLKIEGVGLSSIQGDIRFIDAARAMGAQITGDAHSLQVRRGRWPLKAISLDCNHIPDAAMTLAAMALYAEGTTELTNIASWRVKETDRIAAMAAELGRLGAHCEAGEDYLRITPPRDAAHWRAASIHTYDDHRMAMCLSLAAFNPAGLPLRILEPGCVAKTFPGYFDALLGVAQTAAERIPVICIDGPTASGKGTLAAAVAARLGYHLLDSGALYRLTALSAAQHGVGPQPANEAALAELAACLPVRFDAGRIWLAGQDVSEAIRSEQIGMQASQVSQLPRVRAALVALQHGFRRLPGLVADGRDMGTVIFPQAPLKIYLTASAQCRAERRYKQLISKGFATTIADLRADLEARDARDMQRQSAPLKPAEDALLLDSSELTIEETVEQVLGWWQARQPFAR